MQEMTEFQQRAAAAAVMKMLRSKHFSICDLESVAKTMGREQQLAGRDYAALRSLHCVDWAEMGPDLARMTREKCLDCWACPHRQSRWRMKRHKTSLQSRPAA